MRLPRAASIIKSAEARVKATFIQDLQNYWLQPDDLFPRQNIVSTIHL